MRPSFLYLLLLVLFIQCMAFFYFTKLRSGDDVGMDEFVVAEGPFLTDRERWLFDIHRKKMISALSLKEPLPAPFIFIHIAKTAGTSLVRSIKEIIPFQPFLHYWSVPPKEISLHDVTLYPSGENLFIGGHVAWGIHKWWTKADLPPLPDYTYFTFLREPVSRVLSHYKYHLNPEDPNHIHTVGRSLTDWVRDIRYGRNVMTRYMSGAVHSCWWNDDFPTLMNSVKAEASMVTEADYMRARENLISAVVGMQSTYDKSVAQLNILFNVDVISMVANRGANELDVTDEEIEAIKAANRYDMGLYQLGEYLYAKQSELIVTYNKSGGAQ